MTTIAYKDGIIAYDSKMTRNNIVESFVFEKHFETKEWHAFITGCISDIDHELFLEFLISGKNESDIIPDNSAFLINKKTDDVYLSAINDNGLLWKTKLDPELHYAIGSGSDFAIAAMDLGCTAEDAVKLAAQRDLYTGGAIKTFCITIQENKAA